MTKGLTILITIFLTAFVLIGCSSAPNSNKSVTKPSDQLIKPIHQVASRYGEQNPQIMKTNKDMSDGPTQQSMYIVFLKGNFSKDNLKASNLEFSVLADGSKVWAIRAFDDYNKDVWLDNK